MDVVPLSAGQISVFITEISSIMTKTSEKIMTSQRDYCDNGKFKYMDLDARNPVFAVYEQQQRKPACTSAQSNQRLCSAFSGCSMSPLATRKISIF